MRAALCVKRRALAALVVHFAGEEVGYYRAHDEDAAKHDYRKYRIGHVLRHCDRNDTSEGYGQSNPIRAVSFESKSDLILGQTHC